MSQREESAIPEYLIVALSLSACLIGLVLPFSRLAGIALAVLWVVALMVMLARSD